MKRLLDKNRLGIMGNRIRYVRFFEDFPYVPIHNLWLDIGGSVQSRSDAKAYVVQTGTSIIQRCILMSTDPGDLVLDPTCGSGTTAYVAEQWGRRWITTDTSRIALNIAKTRLMTASFPYYKLYDEANGDLRQGFRYKKVPHITLKSLANDEPAEEETLYDQPEADGKRMRVAGPFTVETLQDYNPLAPEELEAAHYHDENFEENIFEHLRTAGIKNGIKNENAVFTRIDNLNSELLHAAGYYHTADGEKMAYLHIGPKFGSVSRQAVNQAIQECRKRGDSDWLVILGFAFESDIQNQSITTSLGSFEVTKVRMHDDLLQEGLKKKDKKAASFVTIGEADVAVKEIKQKGSKDKLVEVHIQGLDIYDPIRDEVKPRDIHDIAYWMIDDDYDGSNFVVKQVFFCGGDKKEFDKWKKGLSDLSESRSRRRTELQNTLKIEIDEEAFDRLYGHVSHPIEYRKGKRIAVRVISQFGEESTKVIAL
ncbi:MAG: DNA methyltransferase [Bacteroidota bacterium]